MAGWPGPNIEVQEQILLREGSKAAMWVNFDRTQFFMMLSLPCGGVLLVCQALI